jgi:predicted dehydrogenase
MTMANGGVNRRGFLKGSVGLGAAVLIGEATEGSKVIAANDRIRIGLIGAGGRGSYLGKTYRSIAQESGECEIVAVCDVYEKRRKAAAALHQCESYSDFREVLLRKDVDAVIVATPDHWHSRIAIAAMESGKDVYLEKPMAHSIEEAQQIVETTRRTKRVVQVGSQTTSADHWHKTKKAIEDGMIGQMVMSQGSYHRNSIEGEWNDDMDAGAGPDGTGEKHIDWTTWLGPAPHREFDPERFFRFRKFWDYSGGIATDLFYHVVAPLNICWGEPQFPFRVTASGGNYVFKEREAPDTFHFMAEYPKGHSMVLTSTMANNEYIPGTIRGHEATVVMVENGRFEGHTPSIQIKPEADVASADYKRKFGEKKFEIATEDAPEEVVLKRHIRNFLRCIKTREKPPLDVHTAACAQVAISMAVQSYREKKVLFFDERTWQVSDQAATS